MIRFDLDSIKSVYMIAICGTGMTALAGMLKSQGYEVRGSDQNVYPPMSTFLKEIGIPVHEGYDPLHLDPPPDVVVIGNSMSRGNPEVEAVLSAKLPYVSLPFALREFFIRGNYSCVVAGTHGKTTTSSLLAWVLESAGRDPGFFVGGIPENFGRGFKLGKGGIFVAEGDEYDSAFFDKGSKFLHYLPDLVILNSIEFDHADIFRDLDAVETSFARLITLIPQNGYLVACWDNPIVRKLSEHAWAEVVSFGFSPDAQFRAEGIVAGVENTTFEVYFGNKRYGTFSVPLHGRHMVQNALGVIAASHKLGLSAEEVQQAFGSFKNVRRRLQFKGEVRGVRVFDDFAHHPTEIRATIAGLKERFPNSPLWAVFEPRTATSKRRIFQDRFAEAFAQADRVVLTPLHAPDKIPEQERLSVEQVCADLRARGLSCWILPVGDEMLNFLREKVGPGETVLFMSNGDFQQIPQKLIDET